MSEWVQHVGNECPVDRDDVVEVLLGNGGDSPATGIDKAGHWGWGPALGPDGLGRIEKYRVVSGPTGVGDVTSNERGSGARFNAGKPALELIPLSLIVEVEFFKHRNPALDLGGPMDRLSYGYVLDSIGAFQMGHGDRDCLLHAVARLNGDGKAWAECARVFDYGRVKYAAWNWAKGMAWSIPLACAARHIVFGPLAGEDVDSESGLPHRGHVMCNLVMLLWFMDTYAAGDDRCPHRFEAAK